MASKKVFSSTRQLQQIGRATRMQQIGVKAAQLLDLRELFETFEILGHRGAGVPFTLVEVDRFAPTTKTCSMCGSIRKMEQQDRVYECECGAGMDRDVNAARNILTLGLIKERVPTERREYTLGEIQTATGNLTDRLRLIPRVVCKPGSLNQEAPAFRRG